MISITITGPDIAKVQSLGAERQAKSREQKLHDRYMGHNDLTTNDQWSLGAEVAFAAWLGTIPNFDFNISRPDTATDVTITGPGIEPCRVDVKSSNHPNASRLIIPRATSKSVVKVDAYVAMTGPTIDEKTWTYKYRGWIPAWEAERYTRIPHFLSQHKTRLVIPFADLRDGVPYVVREVPA
jgi:hypothetical protein